MRLELTLHFENGQVSHFSRCLEPGAVVLIGRARHCELPIASWRVAREHARLAWSAQGWMLEDLGSLAGTYVNGLRIARHGPLGLADQIVIGPCRLRLAAVGAAAGQAGVVTDGPSPTSARVGASPDERAPQGGGLAAPLWPAETQMPTPLPAEDAAALPEHAGAAALSACRVALHEALIQALDLRRRDVSAMSDGALRQEAAASLVQILREGLVQVPASVDRDELSRLVLDEAVGLGALESLLAEPQISEIMVNGHAQIYVERAGRLERQVGSFSSEQALRHVLERIVTPIGRRIDEAAPMVDARLADGSRVNAVIPPIALRGTCLTIRKFPARHLAMEDLLAAGALSPDMAQYLERSVRERRNVVISGGTGAGKTTLLNVLSNAIPLDERVVTIEDAAELRLAHEHLVALEARPANMEGKGRVEIRDLVRNALRMRPDRIVVGECRGGEAFDMLTAMNTGHEGSLTTLHANSPRDALARLESMVLMAGLDLPVATVREYVAASVDLIVQQARGADGRRRVVAITEVCGMESGTIQLQDLFCYQTDQGFVAPHWQGWPGASP